MPMTSRRSVLAAAAAAALLPGFVPFRANAADAPAGLKTIRVATTPDDASLSVVFAERTGRFRQAGIDVQISIQTSGAAIAAGIAGSSYDVGKSSLNSILSAHLRNVPFTFIAPGGLSDQRIPYGHLIVANDSGIGSAKDLNGKTLSVAALGSLDPVTISAWVDANGGDSKTIKFVELPQTEAPVAIETHRIAAALIIHPQVDAALAGGKVRVLGDPYGALAPLYLISGWFAMTDWVKANSDLVQKFVRIVNETAVYGNAHHAETAPILADFSKLPLPVIQKMTRAILGTSLTPALIQPVIDVSVKYGALARSFPAAEVIAQP
jgi:NitT/TauT family transport system substrate-binding protein